MKTAHGILALSAAALFAFASAATSAAEPVVVAPVVSNDAASPNTDQSGKLLLGIDIQHAGNTPSAVQGFVAGLSPDEQRALQTNCAQILTDGSAVGNLTVLQFCHNLAAG